MAVQTIADKREHLPIGDADYVYSTPGGQVDSPLCSQMVVGNTKDKAGSTSCLDEVKAIARRSFGNKTKQFTCPICKREMKKYNNMVEHLCCVHFDFKDFKCNLCSFRAFTNSKLTNHMLSAHRSKKRSAIINVPSLGKKNGRK